MRSLRALVLVAGLTGCVGEVAPKVPEATFSLIDGLDEAELDYDENLFRSVRKDNRMSGPVTLEGRTERSLTPPVPSTLRYRLRVPEAPVLRFATSALAPGVDPLERPIELSLKVSTADRDDTVFTDLIRPPAANAWRDHEVDLGAWAGQDVTLTVSTTWKAPREIRQPAIASWANPVLASRTHTPDRPHVVVISVDCLRADHVGAYGYGPPTTPSLDALAEESEVYRRAFATGSWTLPTHMSMLTGLLPSFHGATKWEKLSSSIGYLPELLSDSGYRTAGVVSWVYLSQAYGFERGYDSYRVLEGDPDAAHVIDVAIEQLDGGAGQQQFLFVHLYDPHWPYDPSGEQLEAFGARPRDLSEIERRTSRNEPPADEEQVEEVKRLYDAEVLATDHELGRLFRELKSRRMWDDTLLIVTADHGEAFYEHGHWQHTMTLFDDITNVPLIVKWPNGERVGGRDELVSQVDVFQTVADAAGLPGAGTTAGEGVTLRRSLRSREPEPRTIVSEVTWRSEIETRMKIALRDAEYKYVATLTGPAGDDLGLTSLSEEELYALDADPDEQRNLLPDADPQAQAFRAEIRAFLEDALQARSLRDGEAVELDDATLRKLESLGYVH